MSKKLIRTLITHLTPAQRKELEDIIPFESFKRKTKKKSKRTRKRMSKGAKRRNKKKDKDGKSKNHPWYGKSHTKESKEKMSDYALNKRSPDHSPKGENHWNVKLTEEQVKEILIRAVPFKVTYKDLAKEYGVSHHYVAKLLRKGCWAYLDGYRSPKMMILTTTEKEEIITKYTTDVYTKTALAKEYNVSITTICNVIKRSGDFVSTIVYNKSEKESER